WKAVHTTQRRIHNKLLGRSRHASNKGKDEDEGDTTTRRRRDVGKESEPKGDSDEQKEEEDDIPGDTSPQRVQGQEDQATVGVRTKNHPQPVVRDLSVDLQPNLESSQARRRASSQGQDTCQVHQQPQLRSRR